MTTVRFPAPPSRWASAGGVAGPLVFAVTWWLVGRRGRPGYSPLVQPISGLAAYRAPSRPAMTAGFAGYAAGVGALGLGLARSDPRVAGSLAINAASMVAVAALPLDAPYGDTAHVVAATVAYASLAVTPLLDARTGRRGPGASGIAAGIGTGALLVLSQAVPSHRGLLQRLGLSLGHTWIAGRALRAVTQPPS